MSKLLSILIAAVFAVSTGSVFAASHMKAAAEKTDEMKKGDTKKDAKKEMKTDKKAAKKEMKEEKKADKK
jgi:Ni/Co efflux regulator RcnB